MDNRNFFRPIGVAVNAVNNLRMRVNINDNANSEEMDQGRLPVETEYPRNRSQIVRSVWVLKFIPLPVVNYSLLWRRYRPYDLRHCILRTSELVSLTFKLIFRAFFYAISLYFWLRFILTSIGSCGNMVTFSRTFFSDILTYSLRNYPSILVRNYELVTAIKAGNLKEVPMESPKQFLYDSVAIKIQASCTDVKGAVICESVNTSLIFKLSEILVQCYSIWDYLPPCFLTCATVGLYLLYVIGAQILNINIVALVLFITWKRQLPLTKFVIELVKTMWTGSATNVI